MTDRTTIGLTGRVFVPKVPAQPAPSGLLRPGEPITDEADVLLTDEADVGLTG